jgi:hypothetical protein
VAGVVCRRRGRFQRPPPSPGLAALTGRLDPGPTATQSSSSRHLKKKPMVELHRPILSTGHSLAKTRIRLSGFSPDAVGTGPYGPASFRREEAAASGLFFITRTGGPYGPPGSWANGDPSGSPLLLKQRPTVAVHKEAEDLAGVHGGEKGFFSFSGSGCGCDEEPGRVSNHQEI